MAVILLLELRSFTNLPFGNCHHKRGNELGKIFYHQMAACNKAAISVCYLANNEAVSPIDIESLKIDCLRFVVCRLLALAIQG
jgi:hypothetical protein